MTESREKFLQWGRTIWLSLTLAACGFAAPETPESKRPLVFVQAVDETMLFDELNYPARLIPKINATILAESDGTVRSLSIPLGKWIERGQTLMVLSKTDPIYQYAPLKVRAPVSGVVSSIDVSEGSQVARDAKLATITDPRSVRVAIEVTFSDMSSIKPGMKATLKVPSIDQSFPLTVRGVSPFVDPATGTATAELQLDQQYLKKQSFTLPPGLVGNVSFQARKHSGVEIPEMAVFYRERKPVVRIIRDEKAYFTPIKLGPARRGKVEVISGLNPGDQLVVRASTYVADGEAVKVQETEVN